MDVKLDEFIKYANALRVELEITKSKTRNLEHDLREINARIDAFACSEKEWAEKIRLDKFQSMSVDEKTACSNPAAKSLNKSKFWIENRDISGAEIGSGILKLIELIKNYNETEEASLAKEAGKLADKLNIEL